MRAQKHPKEHIICKACGTGFDACPSQHRVYCSRQCFQIVRGAIPERMAINLIRNGAKRYLDHPACYLQEAKAMLEGKHWQGKNKCVKLPGDDEIVQ